MRALRGVDFTMTPGEFVAMMGPSGCGKSTLLNLVAGLDTPTDGEIALAGEPLVGKSEDELARMRRRHIGIVFQFFNLLEGMSVLENVALPAVIAGAPRKRAETRARDLLDLLGPRRQGEGRARRAVGRSAPAARDRPRAGQRADAAARRRAHRRARLRGRPRGARAVPAAARRRPDDPDGHARRRGRRRRRPHRAHARRPHRDRRPKRRPPRSSPARSETRGQGGEPAPRDCGLVSVPGRAPRRDGGRSSSSGCWRGSPAV